jgi:hypothetical protein
VIANCEAINVLRKAGVPENQLMPVSGGERIPLFTRETRDKVSRGEVAVRPGPPGGPIFPSHEFAAFEVHVWPSLHCLMPGASHDEIPAVMDTGTPYHGPGSHPYMCTIDITFGMKHGLLKLGEMVPREHRDEGMQSFIDYVGDTKANVFSNCDGGQLMFNILVGEKQTVLWNAHLGAYKPLMEVLEPKPDVAILGIAGRGNLNGRPFEGSAAEFARDEVHWLGQPEKVVWCLHDERYVSRTRFPGRATLTKMLIYCLVLSSHFLSTPNLQRNWWRRNLRVKSSI